LDSDLPPIPKGIKVGAYYYPWHADDFQRDDGYLRDLLDPRHQPTLGEYDDTRPEIIAQHLAWSRQANIRLWVCSWWGAGAREDTTISNVIMKHTDLGDHQIALLYESTGRVKSSENWDPKRVGPDVERMCDVYFDHPNYYKVDGKPVILMYLTRVLDRYMDNNYVLGDVVAIMRETARKSCNKELFIIGDQVWSSAPKQNEAYPAFDVLDAVTNYDMYGNMNHPPYAGQAVVDDYYEEQRDWKQRAGEKNVRYIPAVSPGYNDRGVRFEKDHVGLSRRLTKDSEPGTLFVAELQQARYLVDPGMDNLLLINSFNEWHEDSQVEPAVGEPTTLPLEVTNGILYEGYGELYLNILRATTCDSSCPPIDKWKSIALQKDPFDGPPPSNVLVGAYYYAWSGPLSDINEGYLRSQLDTRQGPILGDYDDSDPVVIAEHLRMSRKANIGLWIASWGGPDHDIDNTIRNVIFPHKDLGDFQISLLYAINSRVSEANGWDLEIVATDMEYICTAYFDQPNYYRSFGRPVIFVPLTRALYSKGVLESILEMMRSVASHHGYDDIFIVGDQVWSKAPVEEIYMPFFLLDAVTNVDVCGHSTTTMVLSRKSQSSQF
jgi:glycoprotein endo-alpha-1,2-mannosidase